MRRICLTALLTITLTGALAAENGPFAGKWAIDKNQATNVEGAPDVRELEIKQNGNEILVRSKANPPKNGVYPLLWLGVGEYEVKLNGDGSDTVSLFGPYKMQSKTTVEGNKMTTDFTAHNEAGEAVTGQWIRTVSDDGKQLTWEIRSKAADGRTLDKTMVFHKK